MNTTNELILDDIVYTDDLPHIWSIHFTRLASPKSNPDYDEDYAIQVQSDVDAIARMSRANLQPLSIPNTEMEIEAAIM